jgi:Fic family protein
VFVFDLVGHDESDPTYQALAIDSLERQYTFLRSIVTASLSLKRDMISLEMILALNHHAISCLHASAGQLRPCAVRVGKHTPPPHYQVSPLMHMFIDEVNRKWESADPIFLATYVLWRLNYIHPFVNGNGRTARAACYFVLCLKLGRWLEGKPNLPELIRRDRGEYVRALEHATDSHELGATDLRVLHDLLERLLAEQDSYARAAAGLP